MSFNRLHYDTCQYAKQLEQSITPLDYQLFVGKFENEKPCPCNKGKNDNKHCNVEFVRRAEVENELLNLERPGTYVHQRNIIQRIKTLNTVIILQHYVKTYII